MLLSAVASPPLAAIERGNGRRALFPRAARNFTSQAAAWVHRGRVSSRGRREKIVQNSDRVFHHEPVVTLNPGALLSLSFLYAERSGQRERLRSCCGRTGARLIFASRPSFLRFVFFYEMCSEGAFSNAQSKSVISEKALPHIEHAKSNRDQTRLQKRKRLRSEY